VNAIREGEINPYEDLTTQYGVSRDTVRRRLSDMGLTWDYRTKTLHGELKEEYYAVDVVDIFKKKATGGGSTQKKFPEKKKPSKTENMIKLTSNEKKPSIIEERGNRVVKKVTYELDESIHLEMKILSLRQKRNVSELVEEILKQYLQEGNK
jgi:hypothetical protein